MDPAPRDDPRPPDEDSGRFRRTLVRVMLVQVVTLLALWGLQAHYAG
jgi:hypothetical protein